MKHQTATSLLERGWIAYRERELDNAYHMFCSALEACGEGDGPLLRGHIEVAIGKTERDLGRSEDAVDHYSAAVELYRDAKAEIARADAARHVADIFRELHRTEEAEPFILEAIGIYRSHLQSSEAYHGPQPLELHLANGLRVAALLKEQAGRRAEALPLWVEARDNYRAAGVEAGVAESRAHEATASHA